MIVAIMIGREGSTGFPGKNVHPVAGQPLAAWPLVIARHAPSIERIYLSTDSPRLKALAREHGARIIDRPPHLCTKEALGEHAYEHAHHVISAELASDGSAPEIYVLLMANAPTVTPAMLEEGISVLRARPEIDSAVTVSCYNMWSPLRARKIGSDGLLHPFVPFETFGDPKTLNCDRDSQGDVWFADMGVSIVRPRNLDRLEDGLLPQKWMGQRIYPIRNVGGLDVDYQWQLPQAEYWLRANGMIEMEAAPRLGNVAD
jgi:Cytidylyltransferase